MDKITAALFEDKWRHHTDQTFIPVTEPLPFGLPYWTDYVTPSIQSYLGVLSKIAQDYISSLPRGFNRRPNYEDLFSLSEQASRPDIEHVPNLAVIEFQRRLKEETESLWTQFRGLTRLSSDAFHDLASSACDYIHWVVHHELSSVTAPRSGLDTLNAVAEAVDKLDVFTLNHDTLIEAEFNDTGISFDDGFSDRRGDLRVFSRLARKAQRQIRFSEASRIDQLVSPGI